MSIAGLIDYPNRIEDRYALLKIREIIDHINAIKPSVAQNTTSVSNLSSQLQRLTQNVTNVTNVLGVPTGVNPSASAVAIVGTHAQRLSSVHAASQYVTGQLFFEMDRTSMYIVENIGGAQTWRYADGMLSDVRANYPTDLGLNDAGFQFNITDYEHVARWDGGGWRLVGGGGGYFVDSAVTLGAGYQLCNGTVTDFLLDNTTNLAVQSFTTPNEVGLLVHHRSNTSYTGAINAATLPLFTGTAGTSGNDAPTTGQTTPVGGAAPVSDHPHQHPFTPAGTIALPGDPVVTMDVMRYFRR